MFFTINGISCCDSRCENNKFYLFYLFIMNFTETFPCMSSPCHHGNCYEGTGSFYCACELGYTGDACESCKLILISFLMRILKTEEYYCPMSRGEWDLGRGIIGNGHMPPPVDRQAQPKTLPFSNFLGGR